MQGIGAQIRAAREAQGLTQEALAYRSGTALRTITRLEAGEDVRLSTLGQIAEVLGLALDLGAEVA